MKFFQIGIGTSNKYKYFYNKNILKNMKKQNINEELNRMKVLAGLIKESEDGESSTYMDNKIASPNSSMNPQVIEEGPEIIYLSKEMCDWAFTMWEIEIPYNNENKEIKIHARILDIIYDAFDKNRYENYIEIVNKYYKSLKTVFVLNGLGDGEWKIKNIFESSSESAEDEPFNHL